MRSSHLIVDCSSLLYRYFHCFAGTQKKESRKEDSNFMPLVFFKFFEACYEVQAKFNLRNVYFCFDHYTYRYKEFPDYKITRKTKKLERTKEEKDKYEKLEKGFERLEHVLKKLGFRNVFKEYGYEADDMIGFLCKYALPLNEYKIILSSDSDMFQLMNDNTSLFNMSRGINGTLFTAKNFLSVKKIEPKYWNSVKAMMGDGTDDLPGIDGIGEVKAIAFLKRELKKDSAAWKSIAASSDLINRNLKLITLPYDHPNLDYEFLKNAPFRDETKERKWQRFCQKMQFRKLFNCRLMGNNYG